MNSTKLLYATTLLASGLAGFSTGWASRPQEVRIVVSPEEERMMGYQAHYRLSAGDVEALRPIVKAYFDDLRALAEEFDSRHRDQVRAVEDRYDARIAAICTPEKKKR